MKFAMLMLCTLFTIGCVSSDYKAELGNNNLKDELRIWNEAVDHFSEKDYVGAFNNWEILGAHGYSSALYNSAILALSGVVDEPVDESIKKMENAAKMGLIDAQVILAKGYIQGVWGEQNLDRSYHWSTIAAERGNRDASILLKYMHKTNSGISLDVNKIDNDVKRMERIGRSAKDLILFSPPRYLIIPTSEEIEINSMISKANSGDPIYQNTLGEYYKRGGGISVDIDKAVYWFKKASEQGNADAYWNLALLYGIGNGVEKDNKKSFSLILKAAELGNINAAYRVGFILDPSGTGDVAYGAKLDIEKSLYWYEVAANNDHVKAQQRLGQMYLYGMGIDEDYKKAKFWLEKAINNGAGDFANKLYEYLQTKM